MHLHFVALLLRLKLFFSHFEDVILCLVAPVRHLYSGASCHFTLKNLHEVDRLPKARAHVPVCVPCLFCFILVTFA